MPRTLSLLNLKGGCCKSTTALSLAAIWAARGRPVLLVDTDTQSTLSNFFDEPPAHLADVLQGMATVKDAALQVRPNLWLLAADARLSDPRVAWGRLPEMVKKERRMVVIDAPAGWGPPHAAIVQATTDYVIPVSSEQSPLESGISTQARALPVNRSARLAGYLLTRWRDNAMTRAVAEIEVPWLRTRIPQDDRVSRLTATSKTILEGHAGAVRAAYEALADELEQKW